MARSRQQLETSRRHRGVLAALPFALLLAAVVTEAAAAHVAWSRPRLFLVALAAPAGLHVTRRLLGLDRGARIQRRLLGLSPLALDQLSGLEFEHWLATVLRRAGLEVEQTPASRDFGIDLKAQWRGVTLGIEVKRRQGKISNAVVRSVVAGCQFHGCDVAAVVTQSSFTLSAVEQAGSAHLPVLLVGRAELHDVARELKRGAEVARRGS